MSTPAAGEVTVCVRVEVVQGRGAGGLLSGQGAVVLLPVVDQITDSHPLPDQPRCDHRFHDGVFGSVNVEERHETGAHAHLCPCLLCGVSRRCCIGVRRIDLVEAGNRIPAGRAQRCS